MVKATYTFPNGTVVDIDGTVEEVQALHAFYETSPQSRSDPESKTRAPRKSSTAKKSSPDTPDDNAVDLMAIVNEIKSCEEANLIESKILDKKDQVPRVILPLYVCQKYLENAYSLTSGQIAKIAAQLGIKLDQGNVSRCLSGSAKAYVMADSVRKKGQPTGYKISRRGNTHIEEILSTQAP